MRRVRARDGCAMPAMGQGTWRMGERAEARRHEVAALRLGLDLGLTLIDTAEMYGDGGAEQVVAEAIDGRRDEVFLVSKVLPSNASYSGTLRAADRSLKRLRTGCIDLYLLHWPGSHPLEGTFEAFCELREQGKIRHYGVSNFDAEEMQRAEELPGGDDVAVNQVVYNLGRRSVESRLLPWCRRHQVAVMAYSPLEQARLREPRGLRAIAERRGCSTYQVALAWNLREPGVVAIPKATDLAHVRENAAAADLELSDEELATLDREFPRPGPGAPLEML